MKLINNSNIYQRGNVSESIGDKGEAKLPSLRKYRR